MVEVGTIITIAITVVVLGIIGFVVYRRKFASRGFRGGKIYPGRKATPEGEPLEDPHSYERRGGFPRRVIRLVIPAIIGIIVLSVVLV
ncbi:MAG TPA: hypothetical protein VD736_05470 [Nitrososphaera sp.]|nr:hypothetical protein [Nitrososphaera sp.]